MTSPRPSPQTTATRAVRLPAARFVPALLLAALVAITLAAQMLAGHWPLVAILAVTLAGATAPWLAESVTGRRLPAALHGLFALLLFLGPYLGSTFGVYSALPRWDSFVHGYSGIVVGVLGIVLVNTAAGRIGTALPVWFETTAVIALGGLAAAAWEIAEFTSDSLIGTHAQESNTDTMRDIICGTTGCLLIALMMLAQRTRGWFSRLDRILR